MGRASIRQNKNIYQLRREELGLTREKASDVVSAVSPERIESNVRCQDWELTADEMRVLDEAIAEII